MKFNVRKRVLVLVAVVAAVLGLTVTTAAGRAVHQTSTPAPTVAVPTHVHAVHRAALVRSTRSATSRSTQRPSVQAAPSRSAVAPSGATIRVVAVTNPDDAQAAADTCRGPIEILWPGLPAEIAQHDYCGGAWFNSVVAGQRIRVVGGTMPGTYVVNGRRLVVSHGTSASALAGLGSLVLQTCVGSQMVLVGLDRA